MQGELCSIMQILRWCIEFTVQSIWCVIGCVVVWLTYNLGIWWCGGIASVVYFYALYFGYDVSCRYINRKFNVYIRAGSKNG